MEPEGVVNIIFRKQIEAAPEDERDALRNQLVDTIRSQIDAYVAAGWSFLDDLINTGSSRSRRPRSSRRTGRPPVPPA
jgi:acetyl-CoA carboxylase carboxyltransferase component